MLIDWREDFGGLNYGDRYYDLAKLNGGLKLNYSEISAGKPLPFEVSENGHRVSISDLTNEPLMRFQSDLQTFCSTMGYDLERIELITALIYLNMAALHAMPFALFLLYYGQFHLSRALTSIKRQ